MRNENWIRIYYKTISKSLAFITTLSRQILSVQWLWSVCKYMHLSFFYDLWQDWLYLSDVSWSYKELRWQLSGI
jgi:hypothetical protein